MQKFNKQQWRIRFNGAAPRKGGETGYLKQNYGVSGRSFNGAAPRKGGETIDLLMLPSLLLGFNGAAPRKGGETGR